MMAAELRFTLAVVVSSLYLLIGGGIFKFLISCCSIRRSVVFGCS
jgi:hypothetical protein